MTPPRLVLLIRDLNIGGAQRQLIELATGLHRAGWPVKVVVLYGGGGLESDLRDRGVPMAVVGKRGRWDILGFWGRLLRALRAERPAIVHSYLGFENIVAVTMKPFLRGARIVWGVRASNMDYRRYGRLPAILFRVECLLARFADLVISNSDAGRQFRAEHGYPADRIVVIPNGIDVDRFKPDLGARDAVRLEWGVPDHVPLAGIVARLDPKKDHPTFLRAAAAVRADGLDARFVVIGDGPGAYRADLARFASELGLDGTLVWAGARLDMDRVYNALDLIVSTSSWGEGFPNVIAEAMASGVPCVATDAGDTRLVVGDVGWLTRAEDPDDLIRVLRSVMGQQDELRLRGSQARARIVSEFSIPRLVQATSEHLVALANDRT